MMQIDKFRSDITRIVAHARADTTQYDAHTVCSALAAQFENSFRACGELPHAFADYWITKALEDSPDAPSDTYIDKLCAMLALLTDGALSPEDDACFSASDWQEFAALVNDEADNIPLDTLSSLMALFVEKKAL